MWKRIMDAISLFCNEYMNMVYVDVSHAGDSQQALRAPWWALGEISVLHFLFKPMKHKL